MPQQFRRRLSHLHVNFKARVEKVLKLEGQFIPVLDFRLSVRRDQVEGLKGKGFSDLNFPLRLKFYLYWVLVQIRRLSVHHLDGHYPEGPDVHFGAVLFARHDLFFYFLFGDLKGRRV